MVKTYCPAIVRRKPTISAVIFQRPEKSPSAPFLCSICGIVIFTFVSDCWITVCLSPTQAVFPEEQTRLGPVHLSLCLRHLETRGPTTRVAFVGAAAAAAPGTSSYL